MLHYFVRLESETAGWLKTRTCERGVSCSNVGGAWSNLSCTVVMEEGHLKSKRLSHTAKFKHEVIRCAEENGNRTAAAIFGVDESNVWHWRKHKAVISGCDASQRKFTGPKKGQFPEIDNAVFTFFQERRKTGLFVSYDLLHKEIIKKARSLNIPRSHFKASKRWAIRFMRLYHFSKIQLTTTNLIHTRL